MQVTVNLNEEQLDRLNSVMQQYNVTHEEAVLMLISTQPKRSVLSAAWSEFERHNERMRQLKNYMNDASQL